MLHFKLECGSEKESYKEEQKKCLKKRIEMGILSYVTLYGTITTILTPTFFIILKYIEKPAIDFPYYLLWAGLIGYPFAYLMWIIDKKRYEKIK